MRVSLIEAINKLKEGEVVAIPTETVYGLAADASNDVALQKIFKIKQRPSDHPLIVHLANMSQVENWASEFPSIAIKLAETFWPGPLTLVLPAKNHVSRVLRGSESTIALRVPNHPLTLNLLTLSGLALAAPSANLFTQLSPTTVDHVQNSLGSTLPVLDGGACEVGIESTIVSVTADGQWQLLRPGMISLADIMLVAGEFHQVSRSDAMKNINKIPLPKVPGQHALHYAPRTPLSLFEERLELIKACETLSQSQIKTAALLIGEGALPGCVYINLPNDSNKVAEHLYSALHTLDTLMMSRLLVELPPNNPEWLAVLDRLIRAGGSFNNH